jgi:hypothetical protein
MKHVGYPVEAAPWIRERRVLQARIFDVGFESENIHHYTSCSMQQSTDL